MHAHTEYFMSTKYCNRTDGRTDREYFMSTKYYDTYVQTTWNESPTMPLYTYETLQKQKHNMTMNEANVITIRFCHPVRRSKVFM